MNSSGTPGWIDRAIRAYGILVYAFLFLTIIVVVVFSFNAGRYVVEMTGFSFQWYVTAWTNPFIVRAFRTSIAIAAISTIVSAVLGTTTAIAVSSASRWVRRSFDVLVNGAIVVPAIVLGLSLLIFVVTAARWLNNWMVYLVPASNFRFGLGFYSVVAGHSVFGIAIVFLLVRTRWASLDANLAEASGDLYAPPIRTFFRVMLPLLAPAIVAGSLLAFTFSFDDFIIAFFTRGQETTIPIFLFASIRRGVTPVVNAIASTLLAVSLTLLGVAMLVYQRRSAHQMEDGL